MADLGKLNEGLTSMFRLRKVAADGRLEDRGLEELVWEESTRVKGFGDEADGGFSTNAADHPRRSVGYKERTAQREDRLSISTTEWSMARFAVVAFLLGLGPSSGPSWTASYHGITARLCTRARTARERVWRGPASVRL